MQPQSDVELFAFHPLRAKRRPGPPAADALRDAERFVEDAAKLFEFIDNGTLGRGEERELDIPVDEDGRPTRRLQPEEERELARRIQQNGDIDARNLLVLANMGLVYKTAHQMRRGEYTVDDLAQEGTLGLIRATETYDPSLGTRFSTYSVFWIKANMQRLIEKDVRQEMPTIEGAKVDNSGKRARARIVRLDDTVGGDDSDLTVGDATPSDQPDPELSVGDVELSKQVRQILLAAAAKIGDPRLQRLIDDRLLSEEPQSLRAVGETLGLSREGARLLENRLLRQAKPALVAAFN